MYDFSGACSHILPVLKHLAATGRPIARELEFGKLLVFHVQQHVPLEEVRNLAAGLDVSYDFLAPRACDGLSCFEHKQTIRWPSGEPPATICQHLLPVLECLLAYSNRVDSVGDRDGLRVWRMWWNVDTGRLLQLVEVSTDLDFYDEPGDPVARYLPEQGYICQEHRHKIVWQLPTPWTKETRP